jgi:putative FmdB family regulatory protein
MPLYDYVCTRCGHQVEVMHSVHGHGPSACPECGGPMKKAIVAAAVHYKGTGWARKERSSGGTSKSARSDSPSSSGAGTGGGETPSSSDSDSSAGGGEAPAPTLPAKDGD